MVSNVKAYVAVAMALFAVIATAIADNVFDGNDAANVAAAVVTAILSGYAVWKAPRNKSIGSNGSLEDEH